MYSFEKAIELVDVDISIKKEDRESYSKDFDAIRNHVLDIMGKENRVFKSIYSGPSLFGSYFENMKIDKPDEFDVHFVLKLPHNDKMVTKTDPHRPGFVNLDITHVLSHIKKDVNLHWYLSTLEQLVDANCYLDRYKLQNWIEQILNVALPRYGQRVRIEGKREYALSYSKCATAHTIKARSASRVMSIDFVPAFKFTESESLVLNKKFPSWVKEKIWFAVPKSMKSDKPGKNRLFGVVAPQIEKHLLNNKFNLKPSLRLLKSLRDKMGPDARKLKSYFIKTIYLHENDKYGDNLWQKPIGYILLHMLDVLINYLNQGQIPFYWDPRQNKLNLVQRREIEIMKTLFINVKNKLQIMSSQSYVNYVAIRSLFDDPSDFVNAEKA